MEDCSSSNSNLVSCPIRSTKEKERRGHTIVLAQSVMAQEWNLSNDLFISCVKMHIAICERDDMKFSASHWDSMRKLLKAPTKEVMVNKLKELRVEALLFKEFLVEDNVAYDPDTGIVTLPNYFWVKTINAGKYENFMSKRNFKSLKEWISVFEKETLLLGDERSVNTKRKGKNVMTESSKRSKSSIDYESMEMNKLHEVEQCDMIFADLKESGYISLLGSIKLHKKVKGDGDTAYFLGLDNTEERWCFVTETLKKVALKDKKNISEYILKDVN